MSRRTVRKFRTPEAMARFAAGVFAKTLRGKRTGSLVAALSGGKTPVPFFKTLRGMKLDWARTHFFMADERLVPPGSPLSNFGQARRLLFSKIKVPAGNLHHVRPGKPARAAAAYEKELRRLAGNSGGPDIVFLGLGEDGHTASLFPGSQAPAGSRRLILPSRAPRGIAPASRITLTLPALNSAGTIVLMASGPSKERVFARAAAGDSAIPAGRLRPRGKFYLLFSKK